VRFFLLLIALCSFLESCSESIESKKFDSFLKEPCMILNYQQNNTIEGDYFIIDMISLSDSIIELNLPKDFYLNQFNLSSWTIGWGKGTPYYDAGCENIREIKIISENKITLGQLLRGNGFPKEGQRVVFWNRNPSGFTNEIKLPVINPNIWHDFVGQSISFGSVVYDSLIKKWVMVVTECDSPKMQIYAAISDDLIHWKAANNGKAILTPNDFKFCTWTGKNQNNSNFQTPFVTDILYHNNRWFLFMNGYDKNGKKHVGLAVSKQSVLGPYNIITTPVLSPGQKGRWDENSCFYAKVTKYRNGFVMFYDGRNEAGHECVGMATSTDLVHWKKNKMNPVIDQHLGWRSNEKTSEPNYIEIKKDTIILMVAGRKQFNLRSWNIFETSNLNMDKSGNVDDAQLGIFLSTNGGKTFFPHKYNPVFINDYSNLYENEHMGGNFVLINNQNMQFIFYQAKSSYQGLKYNIMLRQKKK